MHSTCIMLSLQQLDTLSLTHFVDEVADTQLWIACIWLHGNVHHQGQHAHQLGVCRETSGCYGLLQGIEGTCVRMVSERIHCVMCCRPDPSAPQTQVCAWKVQEQHLHLVA